MKRRVGRPKEVAGKLMTCTFELTFLQRRFLQRQAKAMAASRSQVMRTLLDHAMVQVLAGAEEDMGAETDALPLAKCP